MMMPSIQLSRVRIQPQPNPANQSLPFSSLEMSSLSLSLSLIPIAISLIPSKPGVSYPASLVSMATTSLKALHHPLLHHRHRPFLSPPDSSLFLRPSTAATPKLFSNLSPASAPLTAAPSTSSTSLDDLAAHLSSNDFRLADEETRRLLIALAGEAAQKRGYVFFSEVQFIPADALLAIDQLWRERSGGRFGYSVQRSIWGKARRDFTRFFVRVGWMKKLDTEVEQYNYRAFPDEFMWELTADTPDGHLPLTNALRGTQLLTCILTHPAFEESSEEVREEKGMEGKERSKLLRTFKTDYSF